MDKIIEKLDKRMNDNIRFLDDKNRSLSKTERTLLKTEIAFMKEIKTDLEKLNNIL